MKKRLTDKGMEVDEVVDIDLPTKTNPQKESLKLSKDRLEEEKNKWNNNPTVKANGLMAINKWFVYITIPAIAILIIALLTTNVIWFNYSFANKNFTIANENNINVDSPDVPILNNYENIFNFTIVNENTFTEGFVNALKEILNITD